MSSDINTATNNRLIVTKAALWFVVGVATVVAFVRYTRGLGMTTALTDSTPWGLWIGFDVLAGVALAAGGFVIAATVHIFGRERYHDILRPAIMTAFLGYLGVIIGLLVDLGRPWNIWQTFFHWNLHSPLFEVAMCVILYTTVLALEFAPVILERYQWARPAVRLLRRLVLPLVILGICLSTLHQSSLGTLFLLAESRLYPLWFSPIQPFIFLVSAIGLGLAMVILESLVTSWLYRREPEWPLLTGLSRAAATLLSLYLAVRLVDLGLRGQLGHAFASSWIATLFWIEILMSAGVPILLFTHPRTRGTSWAVGWGALLTVSGFIFHRANVGGISHIAVTGEAYVPALSELVISVGIVSGLGLVFLFFVENLKVWHEKPATPNQFTPPAVDPVSSLYIRSPWLGGGQRAVLAWIVGVVAGIVLMEVQVAARNQTAASPVRPPRNVLVSRTARSFLPGNDFQLVAAGHQDSSNGGSIHRAMLIDSGGTGRFVLFEHKCHEQRLGEQQSCGACHHMNVPLDEATSCARCHRDMYRPTDIFAHDQHVQALGGQTACAGCHPDPAAAKIRTATKPCTECHKPLDPAVTLIDSSQSHTPGMAPGYIQAMHGLCIGCHRDHEAQAEATEPYLSSCAACHREDFNDKNELLRRLNAVVYSVASHAALDTSGDLDLKTGLGVSVSQQKGLKP